MSGVSIFSCAHFGDDYCSGLCLGLRVFYFFSFHFFPVSIFLGRSCHGYCQGCVLTLPHSDLSVRAMMELEPTASAAVRLSPMPVWVVVDGSAPDLQAGVWLQRNLWLCLTPWSIVSSFDSLVFPLQSTPIPQVLISKGLIPGEFIFVFVGEGWGKRILPFETKTQGGATLCVLVRLWTSDKLTHC